MINGESMLVTKDELVEPRVKGAVERTWEVERLCVMHLGDAEERFEIAWADTFPGL